MSQRSFVKECDFVTSPGHFYKGKTRQEMGLPGEGPTRVITDLGVFNFNNGIEMTLTEIYPDVELDKIKSSCSWDLKVADQLKTVSKPKNSELILLRKKLDPQKLYL